MIENHLYQLMRGLVSEALLEAIKHDLLPLLNKKTMNDQRLMTYTEAMTKLRISKPTFFKLLRENRLPKIKIDKKTFRIDPRDLQQFIENQKA